MALPSSGAISLSQVNTELGVSATATRSLNDATTRTLFGVASGAISMSNGYGKANAFAFTIASSQANADLRTLAINAGWNGTSKLTATINSGVYIYSNSTGSPALTISGSFPNGLTLNNAGVIIGRGGAGGAGAGAFNTPACTAGGTGGTGLSVSSAVTINNTGIISGGGGGGGGGADPQGKSAQGAGGGGGGGIGNGAGGAGGPGGGQYNGNPGTAGTLTAAGTGGTGAYGQGITGGNGGSYGAAGAAGSVAGGAGGGAVSGNSNITWTATGTRYGAIA